MSLSHKSQTRLVALNLAVWLVTGVTALALVGGPRGLAKTYLEPIERELGGWAGLVLAAAGWNDLPRLPAYELEIEPRVFGAATLLNGSDDSESRQPSERWWFPARFVVHGATYPVDLQVLGSGAAARGIADHAWRIRFTDKESYRGFRELELRPAEEERNSLELTIRKVARSMNLLAPPAGFASLRINGNELGNFFWSEGNSREMLERLGYPIGEILAPIAPAVTIPGRLAGSGEHPVTLSEHELTLREDEDISDVAADKLDRLIALTRHSDDETFAAEIGDLLDIEKYLSWNVLGWIFAPGGSQDPIQVHGATTWYLDPVTGLLEPVVKLGAADTALLDSAGAERVYESAELARRLLEIPSHRNRRNEILWQQVGVGGTDLAAEADAELGTVLTRLARSNGMLAHIGTLHRYAELRRSRRTQLGRRIAMLGTAVAASQIDTNPLLGDARGAAGLSLELEPAGLARILLSELRLELGSAPETRLAPVRMRLIAPDGERVRDERVEVEVIGSSLALHPARIALDAGAAGPSAHADGAWTLELMLPSTAVEDLASIEVVYRNELTGEALPTTRLLAADLTDRRDDVAERLDSLPDILAASGLPFALDGDRLVLPAGEHTLTKTLVVPVSHALVLEPGVDLRMGKNVSLISFRALQARGTADQPILIRAENPKRPFGVVGVARAADVSRLAFVRISGGSRALLDGIRFSGQLSFNAAWVELSDSEIRGALGADGMSVKRGDFEIVRTTFSENGMDGLDTGWSRGSVRSCEFANNGDDGIDVNSSHVSIDESSFQWMNDKSIVAGARSRVDVASAEFTDSAIAVTSKNGSVVNVSDSHFRRNRVGFSLFRDKAVFGGGSGKVTDGVFARNEQDVSVEPGSHLELIRVQRVPAGSDPALADARSPEEQSATPLP